MIDLGLIPRWNGEERCGATSSLSLLKNTPKSMREGGEEVKRLRMWGWMGEWSLGLRGSGARWEVVRWITRLRRDESARQGCAPDLHGGSARAAWLLTIRGAVGREHRPRSDVCFAWRVNGRRGSGGPNAAVSRVVHTRVVGGSGGDFVCMRM